ncbi:probable pancreatic secretory proteinase inhibitor isoform X12 [Erpetoichthys calabaricus]|uniref:probable pancreatic secretory proteinase inhibitor isoform X8 n=1 Tax=Erpetoichthys calabaricus TaxID=27687 RepID=UPI00109F03AF|nr:probable pancreatic secretory proteinase inhibitor isoform X8 [Erpetoichthys calabaricus]XP_051790218.1 probable pancreatic secretory proteinase inhibitor isoform X9 [Erpetoichthys calabaricus]XP_051790220.1 probable pancreatic secretory proteinase inhibitor isoform X11 [Erpetoichthys calabaricus]XP_051790221.1 probable pancreatic secretory proteinase inhibitor isoform X12 [Erpetoichthys calabaricus]
MSAMRLLLLCVAFICLSDMRSEAEFPPQPNCYNLMRVDCSTMNDVVCATNGKTYPSSCSFCNVKRRTVNEIWVAKNGAC